MPKIESPKSGGLNEADRLQIGNLLLKAGYAVCLGKEQSKGKAYNHFVEYWEKDKEEFNVQTK